MFNEFLPSLEALPINPAGLMGNASLTHPTSRLAPIDG